VRAGDNKKPRSRYRTTGTTHPDYASASAPVGRRRGAPLTGPIPHCRLPVELKLTYHTAALSAVQGTWKQCSLARWALSSSLRSSSVCCAPCPLRRRLAVLAPRLSHVRWDGDGGWRVGAGAPGTRHPSDARCMMQSSLTSAAERSAQPFHFHRRHRYNTQAQAPRAPSATCHVPSHPHPHPLPRHQVDGVAPVPGGWRCV
jgi:hypothetical protein